MFFTDRYGKTIKAYMVLIHFIRVVILGVYHVIKRFVLFCVESLKKLNFYEKGFLVSLIVASFLVLSEWMTYSIEFDKNHMISRHRIYTDDFLLFVICFVFAGSSLLRNFADKDHKSLGLFIYIRMFSLFAAFLLYLISLIYPERISSSPEAAFTWQFYSFGLVLPITLFFGYKGMSNSCPVSV